MLTGEQIRAARSMLRLSQRQLAEMTHVSVYAVRRMESVSGPLPYPEALIETVRTSIEAAGLRFIDAGAPSSGGGPGVRLEGEVIAADEIADLEPIAEHEPHRDIVARPAG